MNYKKPSIIVFFYTMIVNNRDYSYSASSLVVTNQIISTILLGKTSYKTINLKKFEMFINFIFFKKLDTKKGN